MRIAGGSFVSKSGVQVEDEADTVEGSIHQDKPGYAEVIKSSLLNKIKFISHITCSLSVGRGICSSHSGN